jgi:glycosyltransferase involved in cell wall biosynthesis
LKVAAIVPAYNEEARLAGVLAPLLETPAIDEVVVVDDGSTDATAATARRFAESCPRLRLIELPENRGKGGAMVCGARNTTAETILFLDADLIGLKPEHVADLVGPVASGEAEMTIGVFRGGRGATDLSHYLVAWISGQRAMRRQSFLTITCVAESRSGVETAITRHARARKWRVRPVVMHGVTHTMKEEKIGVLRGAAARFRMYAEIGRSLLEPHTPEPEPADLPASDEPRVAPDEAG